MNDTPRHTLARIIAEHGRGICDAPKRVEALLKDLCGAHRREINIIMGALDERIAADLMAAGDSSSSSAVPGEALLARLAARLRDNLAYTAEAALWGVETWAFALGLLSEAEIQTRAKASEASRSNAPPTVRDTKPFGATPASKQNSPTPQTQGGTTYAPPAPQLPQSSKTIPLPPIFRTNPPRQMPTMPPNVTVPQPPTQHKSPSLPSPKTSRRVLSWRGCFIVFVLAIILIAAALFVVPAIIHILQEEQAMPSINEPRIR